MSLRPRIRQWPGKKSSWLSKQMERKWRPRWTTLWTLAPEGRKEATTLTLGCRVQVGLEHHLRSRSHWVEKSMAVRTQWRSMATQSTERKRVRYKDFMVGWRKRRLPGNILPSKLLLLPLAWKKIVSWLESWGHRQRGAMLIPSALALWWAKTHFLSWKMHTVITSLTLMGFYEDAII